MQRRLRRGLTGLGLPLPSHLRTLSRGGQAWQRRRLQRGLFGPGLPLLPLFHSLSGGEAARWRRRRHQGDESLGQERGRRQQRLQGGGLFLLSHIRLPISTTTPWTSWGRGGGGGEGRRSGGFGSVFTAAGCPRRRSAWGGGLFMRSSQSGPGWLTTFGSPWRRGGARPRGAAVRSPSLMPSWSAGRSGGPLSGCLGCTRRSAVGGPPGILGSSSRTTPGFGSRGSLRRSVFCGSVSASPSFITSGGFDPLGGGSRSGGRGICRRRPSAERRRTFSGPSGGIGLALGWGRFGRRRGGAGAASRGGMRRSRGRHSSRCGAGMGFSVASRTRLRGGW